MILFARENGARQTRIPKPKEMFSFDEMSAVRAEREEAARTITAQDLASAAAGDEDEDDLDLIDAHGDAKIAGEAFLEDYSSDLLVNEF